MPVAPHSSASSKGDQERGGEWNWSLDFMNWAFAALAEINLLAYFGEYAVDQPDQVGWAQFDLQAAAAGADVNRGVLTG